MTFSSSWDKTLKFCRAISPWSRKMGGAPEERWRSEAPCSLSILKSVSIRAMCRLRQVESLWRIPPAR